ncbi:MAG: DUF4321 domain-containing protein [Candidatus Schekmanbacteria bacterium]|nr:DUF4321 domain-containing protein [Candidatus Schekmanbacteria bacterium]
MQGSNLILFLVLIILGMLVGNIVSDLFLLIPSDVVSKIFSTGFNVTLGTTKLNLKFFEFEVGFKFLVNIGTAGGFFLGIFLYKWIGK